MSLAVQAQIRRNAEELREYLEDLKKWEHSFDGGGGFSRNSKRHNEEQGQKGPQKPKFHSQQHQAKSEENEATTSLHAEIKSAHHFELAQISTKAEKKDHSNSKKKYARDLNSLPDYYKAWDAYNPDFEDEESPADTRLEASLKKKAPEPKPSSVRLHLESSLFSKQRSKQRLNRMQKRYYRHFPCQMNHCLKAQNPHHIF